MNMISTNRYSIYQPKYNNTKQISKLYKNPKKVETDQTKQNKPTNLPLK